MYYNRLRQIRGDRTQAEMASMLGMSQANYGYYENGKQSLKSTQIEQICKLFGCSAEWLLCFDSQSEDVDPTEAELHDLYAKMDQRSRDALMLVARGLVCGSQGPKPEH